MKVIWKYEIPIAEQFSLAIPQYGEILSVQLQNNKPKMWVVVDSDEETIVRTFQLVGTGNKEIKNGMLYIGTFQMPPYVWHLYEGK